jgi:hypothetical protein
MSPIRLLIVTGFKTLEGFQLPVENRTLLWGLDQANIEWRLYNPWKPRPNLKRFDAVYISPYLSLYMDFARHCRPFERLCRRREIPVINTIANSNNLHSYFLRLWRERGIRCARFEKFQEFHEITMNSYPMILRRDGVHRGNAMFFAENPDHARHLIESQRKAAEEAGFNRRGPYALDLAVEFIDTRGADGYYNKWRSYVVGDEVIPAHFMRSRTPFVNYKDAALWAGACSIDQAFRQNGEPRSDLILAAVRAADLDIATIDYSVQPDGTYVFWEINKRRASAGDNHVRWLQTRDVDFEFGAAVARLVRRRVEEGARPEPVALAEAAA